MIESRWMQATNSRHTWQLKGDTWLLFLRPRSRGCPGRRLAHPSTPPTHPHECPIQPLCPSEYAGVPFAPCAHPSMRASHSPPLPIRACERPIQLWTAFGASGLDGSGTGCCEADRQQGSASDVRACRPAPSEASQPLLVAPRATRRALVCPRIFHHKPLSYVTLGG